MSRTEASTLDLAAPTVLVGPATDSAPEPRRVQGALAGPHDVVALATHRFLSVGVCFTCEMVTEPIPLARARAWMTVHQSLFATAVVVRSTGKPVVLPPPIVPRHPLHALLVRMLIGIAKVAGIRLVER